MPDPQGLLQRSGTQNRFLRLTSADMLEDHAVEALLAAAIDQSKTPSPLSGRGQTIVRTIAEKQRPRKTVTLARRGSSRC